VPYLLFSLVPSIKILEQKLSQRERDDEMKAKGTFQSMPMMQTVGMCYVDLISKFDKNQKSTTINAISHKLMLNIMYNV